MATTMFTRTINTYEATAYAVEVDKTTKQAAVKTLGTAQFISTNGSATEARAALKAAGVPVKRGTLVEYEVIESVKYGMPVELFMQYATPISANSDIIEA